MPPHPRDRVIHTAAGPGRDDPGAWDASRARAVADTLVAAARARAGSVADATASSSASPWDDAPDRIRERFPELAGPELDELERTQRRFAREHADRLRERSETGRVRDAPGPPLRWVDLRLAGDGVEIRPPALQPRPPGTPPPARDLCVDAVSVGLDFAYAGRPDLAERLLSAFADRADDFELYGVVDHYARACSLARAAAGDDPDEARRWLQLALSTRRPHALPPELVAVGGLVASGKSTVARLVAERMSAPRIEADHARSDLARDDPTRSLAPGFEDTVYAELLRRAEIVLSSGRPVVLDACFPRRAQREAARDLAVARGWPFRFIECRVDAKTTRARLAAREDAAAPEAEPGAWRRIHDDLARRWEPSDHLPAEERIALDCSRPPEETAAILEPRIAAAPAGHVLP